MLAFRINYNQPKHNYLVKVLKLNKLNKYRNLNKKEAFL